MFPHTITIFNITKENGIVKYNRKIVNDVFYYTQKAISEEGKGDKYSYLYHVIFSNDALKDYLENSQYSKLEDKSNNYTLKEKDIIVLNECEEITDLLDLQNSDNNYFLIRKINDNRYGSDDLQNIEVTN